MGKFNHLNVPNQWQHYWSSYPEGYTILEALLNWVAQVDNMVDNQNQLNDTVTSYGNRLDDFIEQFDDNLQTEVTEVLSEWQQSGFLDVVISEALQTEIDIVKTDLTQIVTNVKKYGAVGDGVTDDTLAIQRASDYLTENGGGTLFFPKGVYLHSGLTITHSLEGDNSTLKYHGMGVGVTIENSSVNVEEITFSSTGLDTALAKVNSGIEVNFHNSHFVGGNGYGIHIEGVTHSLTFSGRCSIKNNKSHGIFSNDIKRSNFLGCFISGNGGYGIYIDGYSHGPIIEHNQIWGNLQGGIYIQGEKEGDSTLKLSPTVTPSQHPILIGNHIDHNQDDVDTLKPSYGIFLDGVDRPTIVGNLIRTSRTEGVHIENSSYGTIMGNEIWKIEQGTAINLTTTAGRYTLIGNVYTNPDVLVMADPNNHTVLGVDVSNNYIYGSLSVLELFNFRGGGGSIRQYASGGGAGNMQIDLNSTSGRSLFIRNGANDFTLDVGAKTLKLKDVNGVSRSITINSSGQLVVT
jgi:parallel beta-helix repeat protein